MLWLGKHLLFILPGYFLKELNTLTWSNVIMFVKFSQVFFGQIFCFCI